VRAAADARRGGAGRSARRHPAHRCQRGADRGRGPPGLSAAAHAPARRSRRRSRPAQLRPCSCRAGERIAERMAALRYSDPCSHCGGERHRPRRAPAPAQGKEQGRLLCPRCHHIVSAGAARRDPGAAPPRRHVDRCQPHGVPHPLAPTTPSKIHSPSLMERAAVSVHVLAISVFRVSSRRGRMGRAASTRRAGTASCSPTLSTRASPRSSRACLPNSARS